MGMYDPVEKWYIVIMKTKLGTYAGFKFVQAINPEEARVKGSKNEFGRTSDYLIDSLIETGGDSPPHICR